MISPSLRRWKPEEEAVFMAGLRAMDGVGGLEHGFYGSLHRFDEPAFLQSLDSRWSLALTCLPGAMDRLAVDPAFGLASPSDEGRARALEYMRCALKAVRRLNDFFGRRAVPVVSVHSLPRQGSRDAFARSLEELRRWDWEGAELLVEHCDRWRDDRAPDKGFLPLEDELWALAQTRTAASPARMLINWGRSALEEQDPVAVLRHIGLCKAEGALGGLMFSGCTQYHPHYGHWKDAHAPFTEDEPLSLMDEVQTRACLKAAGPDLKVLGFKIMAKPEDVPVEARLELVRSSLERLRGTIATLRG